MKSQPAGVVNHKFGDKLPLLSIHAGGYRPSGSASSPFVQYRILHPLTTDAHVCKRLAGASFLGSETGES